MKRGRPKVADVATDLKIRMSSKDRDALENASKQGHCSLGEVVRRMIRSGIEHDLEIPPISNETLFEEHDRLLNCVAYQTVEPMIAYILSVWKRDPDSLVPTEWVVWMHNKQDHGFYHGHYFNDFNAAADAFKERCCLYPLT